MLSLTSLINDGLCLSLIRLDEALGPVLLHADPQRAAGLRRSWQQFGTRPPEVNTHRVNMKT